MLTPSLRVATAIVVGIIVSLSLAGCNATVAPSASPIAAQPVQSTLTTSTPAPPSGQSGAPSPNESAATAAKPAVWLDAGRLREPRNATHVVIVGKGKVLVVGSDNVCTPATGGSDSAELGDPQTKVWKKTTSLPSRRETPVLVPLQDGRALLTGGETGEEGGPTAYSSTYVFDSRDSSWSRSGLLNTARTEPAASGLADGRVLVAGGMYIDKTQDPRALNSSELWDPKSGTWSPTGRLDAPRFGASAVTLADGRVLIVGGVASPESAPIQQASAEIYEPTTGKWSSAGRLPAARSDFALVALPDGGALVAGGYGGLGTSGLTYLSTAERFDPVSNTWSATDDLLSAVAGATGIRLADGRVLLAGGSASAPDQTGGDPSAFVAGFTADAELFDPTTGTWTATTPMPSPRVGASAVLLADGSAIFAGGSASAGNPGDTPGCPEAQPQVVRYVPGS